jgi:hypothetical protein
MTSPPEPSPPKVFISYAWRNQPVAKQLQRDLQRDGVEVFVDYEKITGGDSLPDRISAALDWCNTLVLLWSADSAESYYVKQEWTSAFHLQKRIIACVLDNTALPALLRGRLWLSFSPYETGYPQLCRSLGVKPKIATPAPVPPSTLPPQHVEFPVGDQAPSSTEVRESPPPITQKPEPVSAKPAPKSKRWQPKTTIGSLRGSAAAQRVAAWWPRGKVMNVTFAIIVVAVAAVVYKMMCQPPSPTSQKSVNADSLGVPPLRLRSTGKILSEEEVKTMLAKYGFYDSNWNKNGKGITHRYKPETIAGDKVVHDEATGLTWQQSGSLNSMTFADAEKYVDGLNTKKFAGYNDWRLPTLEEAMSLMEPSEPDGDLYIDLLFDRKQRWIWTVDQSSAGVAWVADFDGGYCGHSHVTDGNFVRDVR